MSAVKRFNEAPAPLSLSLDHNKSASSTLGFPASPAEGY